MVITGFGCAIQLANHTTWLVELHLIAPTKPYLATKKREKVFAPDGVNWILGFDVVNSSSTCSYEAHEKSV